MQNGCGSPQCKVLLDKAVSDYEDEKNEVEEMNGQVKELEQAKSEAMTEIAVAKAEV